MPVLSYHKKKIERRAVNLPRRARPCSDRSRRRNLEGVRVPCLKTLHPNLLREIDQGRMEGLEGSQTASVSKMVYLCMSVVDGGKKLMLNNTTLEYLNMHTYRTAVTRTYLHALKGTPGVHKS